MSCEPNAALVAKGAGARTTSMFAGDNFAVRGTTFAKKRIARIVRNPTLPGQMDMRWNKSTARLNRKCSSTGYSMIELLCVMAIIGIMASLLLPAVSRAYHWAKGVTEELEASEVMYLLVKETRHYCTANPKYTFASKSELTDKCNLSLKCQTWVQTASTDFVAFNYLSPSNEVVLVFHVGRNQALTYSFSKADLSAPEQY